MNYELKQSMELNNYYESQIEVISAEIKRVKFKRNWITLSKVATFATLIWIFYLMIASFSSYLILFAVFAVAIFVLLTIWDAKVFEKQNILEATLSFCVQDKNYLCGDISTLATGKEYMNPTHPYTNDLDIFGEESLFQSVNRTVTVNGSKLLANYLSEPCKDKNEIELRQEAAQELKNHIEWSRIFRAIGKVHPTTNSDDKVIDNWQKEGRFFNRKSAIYSVYVSNVITIVAWVLAILNVIPYAIPEIFSLLQLTTTLLLTKRLNRQHNKLNSFIKAVGNYFYLVKSVDEKQFESEKLRSLKAALSSGGRALDAFSSLNKILGSLDQRANIFVTILLDGLYMRSLHNIFLLDKWKLKYGNRINSWIAVISEFDVLISMSNYSFNHPNFTRPKVENGVVLSGKNMCHPLLRGDVKVANDFAVKELHNLFIVTGANMAGKSTFLRTVGVNFVLALSGNVVCSTDFRFTPMAIFTSMRTTDNLSKGTSYFHAELLRLKELTDMALKESSLFIILDEMLKGTNSEDKLNGSIRFLKRLLSLRVCGLVATHDLALGDLSKRYVSNFYNVCFEIDHRDEDIVYDYKLKPGVSKNMNATILLEQMGLIEK